MRKSRPTATKLAQLSPIDAVVYGWACSWLTGDVVGEEPLRLYVDETENMAIRRCLPPNVNPVDCLGRLTDQGLLVMHVWPTEHWWELP